MLRPHLSVFGLFAALAGTAQAADHRVAVVHADPELLRAISLSLSPWNVETIASDAPTPESAEPEAVLHAFELAAKLGVDAIVWVSTSHRGSLLWVYDARTEELTTRVLAEASPFGGAEAAAVALSVKTILRASVVAPRAERFGAKATAEPRRAERLALETGADAHFLAANKTEPRLRLTAVLRSTAHPSLATAITLSAGPGVSVEGGAYQGRYRELTVSWSGRWRFVRSDALTASLFVGAAGHASSLQGTLAEGADNVSVYRLNGSLAAGGLLDFSLGGGAYVGASLQASYLPAYQRYLVEGQPIFALWPVSAMLGGHCGVSLF